MPEFIQPQLASMKSKVPVGNEWLHGIKYDGYRLQIHVNKTSGISPATGTTGP